MIEGRERVEREMREGRERVERERGPRAGIESWAGHLFGSVWACIVLGFDGVPFDPLGCMVSAPTATEPFAMSLAVALSIPPGTSP